MGQKAAEAEAYWVDAAKWKMAAEKSDLSQKELTKEATKMLKMLQDKDALILEKDKAMMTLKERQSSSVKDEDTDKKLQEARKDVLILEKESQFQKSKVEQTKREVEFLKKENFKLDKELQKMKKEVDKPQISGEGSDLLKEMEEVKRQLVQSSSELNKLKKENASTSKKIADLERENKKVTEKNKQLNAELVDEKAKVMVLCELREEEELEDALPPPIRRTGRGPPPPQPPPQQTEPAPEKTKKRPKSMPAKMQPK